MVPGRFANGNGKPGNRLAAALCARAPTDKHRDRNYGRGRVRESPPLHDWLSNVPLTESGHKYRDDQDPGRLHGLYKLTKLIGYYSKYLGLEKRFVANM